MQKALPVFLNKIFYGHHRIPLTANLFSHLYDIFGHLFFNYQLLVGVG